MNQLFSDKGVFRTAPATPGLLTKSRYIFLVMTAVSHIYIKLKKKNCQNKGLENKSNNL